MKKIIFIFEFFFLFFVYLNNSFSEEPVNMAKTNTRTEKFYKFIKKYVITDYNPIFKDKKHMVGLFFGYNSDNMDHYNNITINFYSRARYVDLKRKLFNFNLAYSIPNHFFYLNGRLSISLFYLFGNDKGNYDQSLSYNTANEKWHYKYNLLGVDIIQEIILGNKNLYFTFGAGVAYIFFNDGKFGKQLPHNSLLNAALTATIGHRFENGLIIEAVWKHYSNGELGENNRGINLFGLALRYTFG